MDFRYGEFEMVNGAVCNRLMDENETLERRLRQTIKQYSFKLKKVDIEYKDCLFLISEFDKLLNESKSVLQDLNTNHFRRYGFDIPEVCEIIQKIKEITNKEIK